MMGKHQDGKICPRIREKNPMSDTQGKKKCVHACVVNSNAEFCPHCKRPLVEEKEETQNLPAYPLKYTDFCPGCGYDPRHGHQIFCPGCGHRLDWLCWSERPLLPRQVRK